MNIEEAKANIGKEVVLLEDTKPYTNHSFGATLAGIESGCGVIKAVYEDEGDCLISIREIHKGFKEIQPIYINPKHIALKEPKMQNYKIKVANEAESKEVQDLLFELGYEFRWGKELAHTGYGHIATEGKLIIYGDSQDSFEKYDALEVTLPQLHDLVVLRRNDVSDATHDGENGKKWLVLGKGEKYDFYFWHKESNKWISNPLNTNNRPKMTLIKPQMTWQDALRAVADGKEVEMTGLTDEWKDIAEYHFSRIIRKDSGFRIKPQVQRKELNGNFTKEELLKIVGEMV